jgi:type I restriction enzyme R subunit
VKLSDYRPTKTHEGSAPLSAGKSATATGPTDVGSGRSRQQDKARLAEIVDVLNERFGTDFTAEDQLFFGQVVADLKKESELGYQARNNSTAQFKLAFDPKGLAAVLTRVERNEKISNQFTSNEQLRALVTELMMQQVYQHFQDAPPPQT